MLFTLGPEWCSVSLRNAVQLGRNPHHGGLSTGPKTPEGLERCRMARWKHGLRSAAALQKHKQELAIRKQLAAEVAELFQPW
jgi:hypothetical protein